MKLTIPYYLHKAGAGFPSPATDYIEEDIDLNMHLIRNVPATFIIRVQGKSMVDGTELTYKAGDAYSIDPGHDGWVVGNEPAVVYEFHGKWGE